MQKSKDFFGIEDSVKEKADKIREKTNRSSFKVTHRSSRRSSKVLNNTFNEMDEKESVQT